MLTMQDVHVYWGDSHVITGISLEVCEGEIVSILGRNGAGKTTLLKALMGLNPPRRGSVTWFGREVAGQPAHRLAKAGIRWVPEERLIVPQLSVLENLRIGSQASAAGFRKQCEWLYGIFPALRQKQDARGGSLSGGQQQMLAIARSLIERPKLLLLDEPFEGLAPVIVDDLILSLQRLRDEGITLLVVEQHVRAAFRLAERHYVLDRGQVVRAGTTAELAGDPDLQERFLSVGGRRASV